MAVELVEHEFRWCEFPGFEETSKSYYRMTIISSRRREWCCFWLASNYDNDLTLVDNQEFEHRIPAELLARCVYRAVQMEPDENMNLSGYGWFRKEEGGKTTFITTCGQEHTFSDEDLLILADQV